MKLKIRKLLCIFLLCVVLACPAKASSTFPDVDENAAYAEAAEYLNEIGVMQGDTQGNFNPERNVTRAQMSAIICRMLGETGYNSANEGSFTDVPTSYWAYDNIMTAGIYREPHQASNRRCPAGKVDGDGFAETLQETAGIWEGRPN